MCHPERVKRLEGPDATWAGGRSTRLRLARDDTSRLLGTRDEVARRFGPSRKFEVESRLEEPRRDHAPALEQQLRFAAMKERAGFEHPLRRRNPDRNVRGVADRA